MKKIIHFFAVCILVLTISACQYFTYTPRSKSNIRRQKPSIFICERIVDFRMEYQCWPSSKEDMLARGKKYVDAFQGFPYNRAWFKIKDSNTMVLYFSDHIIDREKFNRPQYVDLNTYRDGRDDINKYNNIERTDLNAYHGYIKFFKVKDKFGWKIKMQR